MTPKERVYAVLNGEKPDVWPVTVPYTMLSNADHWEALTGLPVWKYYDWRFTADLDWYREIYKIIYEKLPFDIVQPDFPAVKYDRENIEVVEKNGKYLYYHKKENRYDPLPDNTHKHSGEGGENEIRYVFNKEDARARIKTCPADKMITDGINDYTNELIKLYGSTRFVVSGGVVNTFYMTTQHVGMAEMLVMLHEEPELIKYISELILEQNIESIRIHASTDCDAVFIDDAIATNDMISTQMYEEFSLPYITQQVKEIQRLGKKAILVYFGGIEDRVEQIASTGADMLMMECAMKGYINDYSDIAAKLKGRMCLAGNLNPYSDIQITSDSELENKIKNMVNQGAAYGKYITSTGSPLTPNTSVERIKKFIDLSHSYNAK